MRTHTVVGDNCLWCKAFVIVVSIIAHFVSIYLILLLRICALITLFTAGEKFETAEVLRKPSQYSYNDEDGNYFFMDSESFEVVMVESKIVEDQKKWIAEGMECDLIFFKDEVIEVRTPSPYVYEVVETEPNVKQDFKPAVLDCGATVNVPGFVEQGSKIKVDTEKGEYLERA